MPSRVALSVSSLPLNCVRERTSQTWFVPREFDVLFGELRSMLLYDLSFRKMTMRLAYELFIVPVKVWRRMPYAIRPHIHELPQFVHIRDCLMMHLRQELT